MLGQLIKNPVLCFAAAQRARHYYTKDQKEHKPKSGLKLHKTISNHDIQ